MGDPVVKNRKVANRGLPPKPKPNVLVQLVPPSKWLLAFDTLTFDYEVARHLFQSGSLPAGFSLEPTGKFGVNPAFRWTLAWQGRLKDHLSELTPLGNELHQRTQALTTGHQGDEFEEDRWKREQQTELEQAVGSQIRREHNKRFLPALNMTAEEAMRTLKPGAYVAAPQRQIVELSPIEPGETFPPQVDWIRDYRDGYFVWIGFTGQMQMVPVSSNDQFWKDIVWYLKHGDRLHDAVKKFDKRWNELYLMMIAGFALALTNAPGTFGRADLGDTAFATAAREANRMIGREVRPPRKFGNVLSKIDPIAAANVGVVGTAVAMQVAQTIEDLNRRKEEQELQSLGDSIMKDLAAKINAVPQKQVDKDLRTGQLGERVARATLELRGYAVVELQNASSHGVDLVAIKVKGGSKGGLILYVEVKTSAKGHAGRLSIAQKDAHAFLRSRLERVVAHETFYKNVPHDVIEIARLLIEQIDAGRPIGGIRVDVQLRRTLGTAMTVKFTHWKPPIPKATALPGKKK